MAEKEYLKDSTGKAIIDAINVIAQLVRERKWKKEPDEPIPPAPPKIYGFYIDGAESDPQNKVTYLEEAVGMTPAHMDYTNNVFDYGSWGNAWFITECKPCILNLDGTVRCYLDKNDFTKDVSGNTVVIDYTLNAGNVMIEFPKIWYKVVPDTDTKSGSVYISDQKVDDGYIDYAYINQEAEHKDHFYKAAYSCQYISNVLRSVSSQGGIMDAYNKNFSQQRDCCKANGTGWDMEQACEIMLINFLLVLIGKSTDTQTVFGNGYSDNINLEFDPGMYDDKGMFFGSNDQNHVVKVFGMEGWWGGCGRRYLGDVLYQSRRKIKMCYGTEDGSTADDYDGIGTGYIDLGTMNVPNNGGYIKNMKFTTNGMYVYDTNSSSGSSSYYCDYVSTASSTNGNAAYLGGGYDGVAGGAFRLVLNTQSSRYFNNGGATISYR